MAQETLFEIDKGGHYTACFGLYPRHCLLIEESKKLLKISYYEKNDKYDNVVHNHNIPGEIDDNRNL